MARHRSTDNDSDPYSFRQRAAGGADAAPEAEERLGEERVPFTADRLPFTGERLPQFTGERPPHFGGERSQPSGERLPFTDERAPFTDERAGFADERTPFTDERAPFAEERLPFGAERGDVSILSSHALLSPGLVLVFFLLFLLFLLLLLLLLFFFFLLIPLPGTLSSREQRGDIVITIGGGAWAGTLRETEGWTERREGGMEDCLLY